MRIAISGSQCVGKSTLLKSIEQSGYFDKDFFFCKEVVRTLMSKGIKINKEADHYSQLSILEQHYINALQYPNLITDRCSVDAFVYATWNYLQGKFTYKEHKEHRELFEANLHKYHRFFYLPPEFPMIEDGVRDIDVNFQQDIHNLFLTIYQDYMVTPIILTGSVEERFNKFLLSL